MSQDIPEKLQILITKLRTLYPHIHYLSEGQSAWVLANKSLVIKVPKTQHRNPRLLHEAKLLKQLQGSLSEQFHIPVWQNTLQFQSLSAWHWAALQVYSKLQGRSWQLKAESKVSSKSLHQFGRNLYTLHQLDLPKNFKTKAVQTIEAFQSQIKSLLRPHCHPRQTRMLNLWFDERCRQLAPFAKHSSQLLIHGDLWAENILLDSTQTLIVGLIDFEAWRCSELADELAPLTYLPKHVSTEVLKGYFAAVEDAPPVGLQSKIYDYLFLRELQGALRNSFDSNPEIYKVLQILEA